MQNSDLRLVLAKAVNEADDRLLRMLYAITKSYQQNPNETTVQVASASTTQTSTDRLYKDERPRKVIRTYRKPTATATTDTAPKATTRVVQATRVVKATPAAAKVATRVVRVAASKVAPKQATRVVEQSSVSGVSRNGASFLNNLKTNF